MKVFTAHQRKSSYYNECQRNDGALKSEAKEDEREKNACRLYSALTMILETVFWLPRKKCQSPISSITKIISDGKYICRGLVRVHKGRVQDVSNEHFLIQGGP